MSLTLFHRRTLWFPTRLGWACILLALLAPCLLWWFAGESFLCVTDRQPGAVLVVEGWIGNEALRGAADEFRRSGAPLVVTTGGLSNERWSEKRYSYADMARYELIRAGVPADRILVAPTVHVETQRTFQMAAQARLIILEKAPETSAINVFTIGPHARRSRLVFEKVFPKGIKVGVVSWVPSTYANQRWWHSSDRADELLKETVCVVLEAALNSGRASNSVAENAPRDGGSVPAAGTTY